MRALMALLTAVLLVTPFTAHAQDRAALEAAVKALGATDLKSIEIQGAGSFFWAGQSQTPGTAWPQFNVRSLKRLVNYETASLRDDMTERARWSRPGAAAPTSAASTPRSRSSAGTTPGT